MNPNIPNDKILKKYNDLPEDIKDALFADEVTKNILEVGKSHGLMIDKIGELSDETGLVMLGITPTADFIKNLSSRLNIDKEKAKTIAEDINQKVFQQIRASLRKVHGMPTDAAEKVEIKTNIQSGKPGPVGEIPKSPIEPRPGEIKTSSPIFAKKIVPIDELLDKIDSGESIIKQKAKIESVPPPVPSGGLRTMFNDVKSAITGGIKKEEKIVVHDEPALKPAPVPPAIVEKKQDVPVPEAVKPETQAPIPEQEKPASLPKLTLSAFTSPGPAPFAPRESTVPSKPNKSEPPANLPVGGESSLSPEEIKAAVEKALGGKITNQAPPSDATPAVPPPVPKTPTQPSPQPSAPLNINRGNDPYREPIE